tara:strand:- start:694 stop:840 length:147 start_codon:yes stop_codon:yes gene_type:complete
MVTEDTGIGNPIKATQVKGKRFFEAICQKQSQLFIEVSDINPEERYEE